MELVIEGSYPYIAGGVSSWIQRLVMSMPDLTFGITHIAARRKTMRKMKYTLPGNVLFLQNLYLFDPVFIPEDPEPIPKEALFRELMLFHDEFKTMPITSFSGLLRRMTDGDVVRRFAPLFSSRESFSLVLSLYQKHASKSSFLDFFWTWRLMHLPMFQILQARRVKARVCHAVSTGFAGLLGTVRKCAQEIPFLLTEHGIYTRERTIEITHADWIYSEEQPEHQVRRTQGTFKRLWMSYFQVLGAWAYEASELVITLNQGNRDAQIALGADPRKIEVIPNGISLETFRDLRPPDPPHPEAFRVGFIGRVVMIKDVRTFLRAAKIVLLSHPRVSFSVIGPLDEEPEYAGEMFRLVQELQIGESLRFLGKQNVTKFFPKLDVVVLTSISEAQPLTILEAMGAGIPCVATDVGSCRELLQGRTPEDQALGESGIVTSLRSPAQTAQGIIDVCGNPDRFARMVETGKRRVERFYQEKQIFGRYRDLYREMRGKAPSWFVGGTPGKVE